MEFDHDAGTNVSCSDRVDFHVSQESERRPVTHCQAVSEIAGSDGSCVQCDTIWPAVHETPAVVAQDQGIFPLRMIRVSRRCVWSMNEHLYCKQIQPVLSGHPILPLWYTGTLQADLL